MNYKNPIPVAVAMIFNSDRSKVLVGERGIEPFIGGDAMLGGFTNEGETPEAAVRREVKEEAGRSIDEAPLQYESSSITHNNRLLLFFSTSVPEVIFDGVESSDEMRNIRFISPTELQAERLGQAPARSVCGTNSDARVKTYVRNPEPQPLVESWGFVLELPKISF